MTRDEFKAYVQGAKHLAASDPDAYLKHIDATNRPGPVCGFCGGRPVGNAAVWLDGKPRPPAGCPRCGETNLPSSGAARGASPGHRPEHAGFPVRVSGSLVRGGDPDPSLSENPNHARDELAVLAALRKGPRARSGLAKAIKAAGNQMCKPGGDDRDVVFTLDRLARLGYDIRSTTDGQGRGRMYLAGDPAHSLDESGSHRRSGSDER